MHYFKGLLTFVALVINSIVDLNFRPGYKARIFPRLAPRKQYTQLLLFLTVDYCSESLLAYWIKSVSQNKKEKTIDM